MSNDWSIKERLQDFDNRHGGDKAFLVDGWLLFPDGAVRENNLLGVLMEPPDDPYQLAKRKLRYASIVLDLAVQAFDERRTFYVNTSRAALNQTWVSPPPAGADAAVTELRKLRSAVRRAQRAVSVAEQEVENSKPEHLKAREAVNEANRQANESFLSQVSEIEV